MAEITAKMVQQLRETTGAGMMDCKKALTETNGDMEAALDWLRKKGLSAAAKKAGRVAAEGLVAVATSTDGQSAAVLEVNAETDFVGRNEHFQKFVLATAQQAMQANDLAALQAMPYPGSPRNVADELTHLIATIGEQMTMRRMQRLQVGQGVVASYVHTAVAPNLGRIGVLVALESAGDKAQLQALGKQIAMHIAAAKPDYLNIASVPAEAVAREKAILTEQAQASGKPAQAIEKMVEGRLRKFYEEMVLLEQTFVIDGERKIAAVVADAAKTVGAPVTLAGFARFNLGEGIAKEQSDFAAEVAKMAS